MVFEDHIVQAIRTAMPRGAEVTVVPGAGAIDVFVGWKLHDDPDRPNKMSKTIRITVSHEAAQDFASASAAGDDVASRRVFQFLSERLQVFNPSHDTPKDESPPVEQWVITTEILNG